MNHSSNGFLESVSWKAILAAIATVLGLIFGFPEYIFNVRPEIERKIGTGTISFIEGAITGALLTVIVLKFLAERYKHKKQEVEKIASQDVKVKD